MPRRSAALLLLLAAACCYSQPALEDVVVLKDGSLFRGTISDRSVPRESVVITQTTGRVSALFRSEIAFLQRLPAGIPDSLIMRYLLHTTWPERAYENEEDVVFFRNGSLLRGVLLDSRVDEPVAIWSSGTLRRSPYGRVIKIAHVEKGISDSMLTLRYVNIPEEWTEGERRIFTLSGGAAFPLGELAEPAGAVQAPLENGFCVGVDAGVRLTNGLRWLTTGLYSHHPRGLPRILLDLGDLGGAASPCNVVALLTGIEGRTTGPWPLQFHMAGQVGMIIMKASSFDVDFPRTFYHLKGTASTAELSATAVAAGVTGGFVIGRFTVDLRWTVSWPRYTARTDILYEYDYTSSEERTIDKRASMVAATVGMSLY